MIFVRLRIYKILISKVSYEIEIMFDEFDSLIKIDLGYSLNLNQSKSTDYQ